MDNQNQETLKTQITDPKPFSAFMAKYPDHGLVGLKRKIATLAYESEYEMVRQGKREANIFHLSPHNYDNEIAQIMRDKLAFLPMRRSLQYEGFSHTHFPTDRLGPDVMVFGVVARDLDIAEDFVKAELKLGGCDHARMGGYLGYPDCCSAAFTENFKVNFDPVMPAALAMPHKKNLDGSISLSNFDPLIRSDLRYYGFKVIPWFPCRYNCEESSERAKVWLGVMRDLEKTKFGEDSGIVDKRVEILSLPATWDLNLGQVITTHPMFRGYVTSYYAPKRQVIHFEFDPKAD